MAKAPDDGLLLVDKPAGMTSHDAVDRARRALRTKRIGHGGTLDPFATGLLVLLVGRATRLLPYLDGEPKAYDATIRFGAETDTDDLTGTVTTEAALPTHAAVEKAIEGLTGDIDQVPPAYSAKQVGGTRAYAAARRGQALALAAVPVRVARWEIRGWRDAECDVSVICGGGTYIRALARDLGRAAGSAAHLSALRRTASGRFSVRDAVTVDAISAAAVREPIEAIPDAARVEVDAAGRSRVARGMTLPAAADSGGVAAIVDESGELVAVAEADGELWQPRVVLVDG
ncbi:MAG: tRNA pseudouridine(55) synthase TruB [Gemmatimonadaceae bacterium]|nr:tRNA pseudouridine(55) synthase TruB [Gemmatimonadaceae bacterium]NUR17921.1 tRNA pseudouridine(55) synthase TruB [Gemmatimonadaceae bacterium]